MADQNDVDLLDQRLKKLEHRMYGCAPREGKYPEVVETLADVGSSLLNTLSTRDRMMAVMKRMEELDEYLDPCYGTSASQLPEGALTDLLLCQDEHWQQQLQNLQQVVQLRPVLDSQPIRECVGQSDRLVELSYKQSELEELELEQSERVTKLLDSYNSIIQTLTETFVRMDEIVTRAEITAQPKKVVD